MNLLLRVSEFAKENWLKTIAGAFTALVAVVTGLWSIDEHYAKAADLSKVEKKLDLGQQSMQLELQIQLNKQTQRDLQSKIEDIEAKEDVKKADSVDKARKSRLTRQLSEIQAETNTLMNQKIQMQVPR